MSKDNTLKRIDKFDDNYKIKNKQYNCFTNNLSDYARTNLSKKSGLLNDKLVAIKDNINIKGYETTCCSKLLHGHHSIYDATVVKRINNEGGSIVAKTNMDEFAMGSSTEFSCFGSVSNPHDITKVAGGSSGGSAAAVASHLVDIALGSDTGGSVRQPAAYCGVYGLKPTYGSISRYGLTAFASSLDQIGIFANNTIDIYNMFKSIAGYDTNDSNTIKEPINLNFYQENIENIKIGYSKKLFEQLDPELSKKYFEILKFLKNQNFNIENIDIEMLDLAIPTYYIIATAEASSNLSRFDGIRYGNRQDADKIEELYSNTRTNLFGDEVKRRIMLGNYVLSSGYYDQYYNKALRVRKLITQHLLTHLESFNVLLLPTAPSVAFSKNEKTNDPISMYLSDIYTIPISLAGLPAMNIPIGKVNELPVGMQICSNYLGENIIFLLSHYLEKHYR